MLQYAALKAMLIHRHAYACTTLQAVSDVKRHHAAIVTDQTEQLIRDLHESVEKIQKSLAASMTDCEARHATDSSGGADADHGDAAAAAATAADDDVETLASGAPLTEKHSELQADWDEVCSDDPDLAEAQQ